MLGIQPRPHRGWAEICVSVDCIKEVNEEVINTIFLFPMIAFIVYFSHCVLTIVALVVFRPTFQKLRDSFANWEMILSFFPWSNNFCLDELEINYFMSENPHIYWKVILEYFLQWRANAKNNCFSFLQLPDLSTTCAEFWSAL